MNERIVTSLGEPETLTPEELELDTLPLTRVPVPQLVRAWVRYDGTPVRIDAEMTAWTPKACAIRWTTPAGKQDRCWVWANAVQERRQ